MRSVGTASLPAGRLFTLGPQVITKVTAKVKAGEGGDVASEDVLAASVHVCVGGGGGGPKGLVFWSLSSQKLVMGSISVSEVSLIPGGVVHVLQDSPDDLLQLLPRPLLLLQRPLHPLVVLEKRDMNGRIQRKSGGRIRDPFVFDESKQVFSCKIGG